MSRPRRTRAAAAAAILAPAIVAAAVLAPAAHADCCTTFDPELGPLIAAQDHALLGYAFVDGQDDGPSTRFGRVARIASDATVTSSDLTGGTEGTARSVPSLSFSGGQAALAWVAGGVRTTTLSTANVLAPATVVSPTGSDVTGAKVAGSVIAWPHGRTLRAPTPLTTTLRSGRAYDVVADRAGNAAVVWVDADGLKVVLAPNGTSPDPASARLLVGRAAMDTGRGRSGILADASDGAGGVRVAFAPSAAAQGMIQLVSLTRDAKQAITVIARRHSGVGTSVALSPGAVAYLAGGVRGRADVMIRRLAPGHAVPKAINLTRTRAAEQSVDGVADAGASTFVIYRRTPKGQHAADVLLNTLGTRRGAEIDVSRSKDVPETDARLAVDDDATAYIAYAVVNDESDSLYSYDCTSIDARTFGANGLSKARRVVSCDLASAT